MQKSKTKPLMFMALIASIVITSSLLTIHFANSSDRLPFEHTGTARDFAKIPFDSLDATRGCEKETRAKFAGDYLRSTVDWHSTRFQESRAVYIVVLDADIGTREKFEEAKVYCYVNPDTYKVSYFKAYDDDQKPMLSTGISFKDMMKSFNF